MLFSLYIVNRAGTLVYNRNLDASLPKLSSNEYLRVGSTFHSLHALAKQAAPVQSGGILSLDANTFTLRCLSTLTGMKFMILAAPGAPSLQTVLEKIYSLYSDYVLKNPFYEFDLLIKCHLFDDGISRLRDKYEASQGMSF
jgi:hypothetical protein